MISAAPLKDPWPTRPASARHLPTPRQLSHSLLKELASRLEAKESIKGKARDAQEGGDDPWGEPFLPGAEELADPPPRHIEGVSQVCLCVAGDAQPCAEHVSAQAERGFSRPGPTAYSR